MDHIRKANKILFLVILLFSISFFFKLKYPDLFLLRWVSFTLEAAVVGGIADWFAVSALFWKPLGFPFHTAIIPRKREKVIKAIANLVEKDLLNVTTLKSKLDRLVLVDYVVDWVDRKGGKEIFLNFLVKHSKDLIEQLDPKAAAASIEKLIKKYFSRLEITPLLRDFAIKFVKSGEDDKLIEELLEELTKEAEKRSTREAIYDKINSLKEAEVEKAGFLGRLLMQVAEKTDALNVSDAADSLHKELVSTLIDLKNPDNDLRITIKEMLEDLVEKLDNRESWKTSVEEWKKGLLDRIDLKEGLENLLADLIRSLTSTTKNFEEAKLVKWAVAQIARYWEEFKQDQQKKVWLENYLKLALIKIIESEHHLIGKIAEETLAQFDKERLNNFILDKVGEDLKWIRFNGSLVGGAIGFVVFLLLTGYDYILAM